MKSRWKKRTSALRTERTPRVPADERARQRRLQSLKLSRSRVEDQLSKAVRPAHRQMLMKALQAIEEEADELSKSPEPRKETN